MRHGIRHHASTQGLLSAPTPCTLTIMRSPGTSGPTPDGVPVVMTSPGSRVQKRVSHSITSGTGKISSRVLECCRFSPLTQPSTSSSDGIEADGDARADRREGVEALGARVLHVLGLQLAGGDVAQAGDAEDVVHRVAGLDPRGAAADHHRHLGLVLDAAGPGRESGSAASGPMTVVGGLMNSSGSAGSGFFISAAWSL